MSTRLNPTTGKLDKVVDVAIEITLDTTNFDGVLSDSDIDVQKAIDTLDDAMASGAAIWGSITGTLSNQSDLQTELDGKANTVHTHVAADITDFQTNVSTNTDVAANTAARHSHANKALLDTYTQTEVNLADAVTKKHTQNSDTSLDFGQPNQVTAAEIRIHLDDVTLHRIINDAGVSTTELWSSDKIQTEINLAVGGVDELGELTDVTLTAPADNEVLAFNTSSGQWINQTAAEANLSEVGHTHVAADITDFQTVVSANTDVTANTAARHSQNTDTSLDLGGTNPVTAAELRSHLDNLNAHDATEVDTDTTNFNNNLSSADNTVQKALDTIDNLVISGGGGVFGDGFQFSENLSVIVTTSDIFQTIIDFTTTSLPAGNYKLEWSYGWNHDNIQNDFHARIGLDDDFTTNNLIMEHREEPSDSSGTAVGRYVASATDQLSRSHGFRILNLTGIKNFKLQFRTSFLSDESSIWDTTITLHRVS